VLQKSENPIKAMSIICSNAKQNDKYALNIHERTRNDEFSRLADSCMLNPELAWNAISCNSSFFNPSKANVPPARAKMANVSSAHAGFIIQNEGLNEDERDNKEP
jgi:hypothetical protein